MIRSVFFGNAPLAAPVLEELARAGHAPSHTISETPLTAHVIDDLAAASWDVFIVASYGAILPRRVLEMPRRGTINVHPSLLPRLRGPSPMRSAILNDERETGVTIIALDEEVDHGPIIAQKKVAVSPWPPRGRELDAQLAREGGRLLAHILPLWVAGELDARPQNHDIATYCARFKKEDALISLADDAYQNLLKIRAFDGWPVAYAMFERAGKRIRVQVLDAHMANEKLVIDTVKPEGKREMTYEEFLRSGARPL